jgi:hypothetical protein
VLEGLSDIAPTVWLQGGAVTVLVGVFWAVLRGGLVPGRVLNEMLRLHAERLAEANSRGDEWRQTAEAAAARADELGRQLDSLLEVGRTTTALIESLKRVTPQRGTGR